MIVCSNGNCKFLNTHLVLGMSNRCLGEGEHTEETRCIVRPREQFDCKNGGDKEKPSNKKKTKKNKKHDKEKNNENPNPKESNLDNEDDLKVEENSKKSEVHELSKNGSPD